MHSDSSGVVVQEARIGVPAGEVMKASGASSHGVGRGQSVVGTPDKVEILCTLNLLNTNVIDMSFHFN